MKQRAPIRILIVPDKFKGTLTAQEVCAAMADGWRSGRLQDKLDLLPMSDGGDGFGEILAALLHARRQKIKTVDAAHRPTVAAWWWDPDKKLAIIESAQVIGLAKLPAKKFHPFQLDTFGLGAVLRESVRLGAKSCLVGIGGSATNDGGFGLARALGWKFLNQQGWELEQWWQLTQLHRIVPPPQKLNLRLTVAADVANPLLGRHGCSRVYGPQKGLRPEDMAQAEKCLRRMSTCLKLQHGKVHATTPGTGAAGGLGFGLMAFANASSRPGFEVFAQAASLAKRIRHSDLVITGEGAIDRQTYMGKGVGQVGRLCKHLGVPCVALAGVIQGPPNRQFFWKTKALTEITTLRAAESSAQRHLKKLAASVANSIMNL